MTAQRLTVEEWLELVDKANQENDLAALDALAEMGLAYTELPDTIIWLDDMEDAE